MTTLAPTTQRYILPDLPWEILLGPILHDAPAGSVIEVHTERMRVLVEQRIAETKRDDVRVELRPEARRN